MYKKYGLLVFAALILCTGPVQAHHSFAVHYVPDKIVSISGVVTEFRFTNPHGLVFLDVKSSAGESEQWIAATNSPNSLRRAGWKNTSLKAGDNVTILGFPTRDGSNSMRIHKVVFADGTELIGQRRVPPNALSDDP